MTDETKRLIFVDIEFIDRLQSENAKLRELLSRAADTIAELSSGGAHLVIMQEIDKALEHDDATP